MLLPTRTNKSRRKQAGIARVILDLKPSGRAVPGDHHHRLGRVADLNPQ